MTANVLNRLGRRDAARSLSLVLAEEPDLVGLQEWGPRRWGLLRRHPAYHWVAPAYGGNVVGARRDRYDVLTHHLAPVGGVEVVDRGARPVPLLPPRVLTLARLHDLRLDRVVVVVVFHLVPGVQAAGAYRADRPRLVARHRRETELLHRVVRRELEHGYVVHALGDSNLHGFAVPGLTSAWAGRPDGEGTLGPHRRVDDVLGPGPATDVRLVVTPSDHRAVVVRRPDPEP